MNRLLSAVTRPVPTALLLVIGVLLLPDTVRAQSAPMPDTQAIATGYYHTCALTNSGGVKCWGNNEAGQLGDNSTAQRLVPVDVSGLTGGVTAIAAGYRHTCALTSTGGVKCWGGNDSGQLGDNSTMQRQMPVDVAGLASGVTAIAAGGFHTCAVTSAGGVKCWGHNSFGQLGDNSTTQHLVPVDVSGLTSGVTLIAAGGEHTCSLVGGAVKCWGQNSSGQLGDNSITSPRLTPVDVIGLAGGVTAIAAGGGHTCAVTGGGAKCWGRNDSGQIGDNSTMQRQMPVDVAGLTSGVTAIAVGEFHTCARTNTGGAMCWGNSDYGQIGDNSTTQRLVPVDVSGLANGVTTIAAGGRHTCALIGGGAKCWGESVYGQLGDNSAAQRLRAVEVSGLASGVTAVAAGWGHTCALIGGGAKCWGLNAAGELGDNSTTQRLAPVDVSGLTGGVTAIAAGSRHTCALTSTGAVKCWGSNSYGQLGDNSTMAHQTPVDVSGLASGVTAIAAGGGHTCALTSVGGVKCWGYNASGQLGDNSTTQRLVPVDVSGLANGVTSIVAGAGHTCAIDSGGGVQCWGMNSHGQLGDNSIANRLAPVDVSGLASGAAGLAAGSVHTCVLTSVGVKCWGSNSYGQLGDNSTMARLTPVDVSGLASGAAGLAAGSVHTCVLTSVGVKCWGSNSYGQLGDNSTMARLTPVDVSGLANGVTAIAAGRAHTCALTSVGGLKCWGDNYYGQLGDSTGGVRPFPADVLVLVPGAPAIGTATAGETSARVTFSAPASNGGAAVDGYRTTCGAASASGAASPIVVPGLANGSSYTCTVAAHNSVGWGPESAASNTVTPPPATAPREPTGVTATAGRAQLTLAFSAPASMGTLDGGSGAVITGYTATCIPAGSASSAASPVIVAGLASGTAHTCTVTATNSAGLTGPASDPSNSATPLSPIVPAAPSGAAATPGNRSAVVAFTPGAEGGAPIDRYRVVCSSSNGGASATSYGSGPPVTNAPLSAGKSYTCVVTAHNSVGWGADSAASASFLVPATVTGLPDTGQDQCWNGSALVACASANTGDAAPYPRQDGRYGRDAAAANGSLAKVGAGDKGFDYTKVANNGGDLPASAALGNGATDWACTRDNATGLTWEVKVNDAGHLRHRDWYYTWYDSNPARNGGYAGLADSGAGAGSDHCLENARCDTEKYVADVNAAALCGYTDWRLPSVHELLCLVHLGPLLPTIDGTYFPNTLAGAFSSSSSNAVNPAVAWWVVFSGGYAGTAAKDFTSQVRLVRGGR